MSGEVPGDVQELLFDHVESFEQLEVLLWLHARASEWWDVETVASGVHISYEDAALALAELTEKKWIVLRGVDAARAFRYAATGADAETIARLATLHENQLLEIMKLMNANAIERVRTAMIKSFANAFVLNRKKKDG